MMTMGIMIMMPRVNNEYASDSGGRKDLSEKNNVVGEISVDDPALALKTDLQKQKLKMVGHHW